MPDTGLLRQGHCCCDVTPECWHYVDTFNRTYLGSRWTNRIGTWDVTDDGTLLADGTAYSLCTIGGNGHVRKQMEMEVVSGKAGFVYGYSSTTFYSYLIIDGNLVKDVTVSAGTHTTNRSRTLPFTPTPPYTIKLCGTNGPPTSANDGTAKFLLDDVLIYHPTNGLGTTQGVYSPDGSGEVNDFKMFMDESGFVSAQLKGHREQCSCGNCPCCGPESHEGVDYTKIKYVFTGFGTPGCSADCNLLNGTWFVDTNGFCNKDRTSGLPAFCSFGVPAIMFSGHQLGSFGGGSGVEADECAWYVVFSSNGGGAIRYQLAGDDAWNDCHGVVKTLPFHSLGAVNPLLCTYPASITAEGTV